MVHFNPQIPRTLFVTYSKAKASPTNSFHPNLNSDNSKLTSIVTQAKKGDCSSKNGQTRSLTASAPVSSQGFYRKCNYILPPMEEEMKGRKTLVLDLDETLVHSSFQDVDHISIEDEEFNVYVLKRPGVDKFLAEMSKYYEIVIYTASLSLYADPLLDELDPYGHATYRLFREHCTFLNNVFVKDLTQLGRDLKDVIIVDNSPACYSLQPENAVPIATWIDDQQDSQLQQLTPFLKLLSRVGDVRPYITRLTGEETDYAAAAKELRAELNCGGRQDAGWTRTCKAGKKAAARNGKAGTPGVGDAGREAFGPAHFRSTTNIIGGQKGSQVVAGKNLEAAVRRPVSRTPTTKTAAFNKEVKKVFQPHQPRQTAGNRGDCSTPKSLSKAAQAPLTQKVADNAGRPSTARHREAPLHVNFVQRKEDANKFARLHSGKPVIIGSNIGTNAAKKHNKHSNSMHDPIQIFNKVKLKKNLLEGKGEEMSGGDKSAKVKPAKATLKQGETARCLTAKGNCREDGKRTPTMKFNPLEIIKFSSGAKSIASSGKVKPAIKAKGGNSLVINAIQMAKGTGKKPIILAHKK